MCTYIYICVCICLCICISVCVSVTKLAQNRQCFVSYLSIIIVTLARSKWTPNKKQGENAGKQVAFPPIPRIRKGSWSLPAGSPYIPRRSPANDRQDGTSAFAHGLHRTPLPNVPKLLRGTHFLNRATQKRKTKLSSSTKHDSQ